MVVAGRWGIAGASTQWCNIVIQQHHIVHWRLQTGDLKIYRKIWELGVGVRGVIFLIQTFCIPKLMGRWSISVLGFSF